MNRKSSYNVLIKFIMYVLIVDREVFTSLALFRSFYNENQTLTILKLS